MNEKALEDWLSILGQTIRNERITDVVPFMTEKLDGIMNDGKILDYALSVEWEHDERLIPNVLVDVTALLPAKQDFIYFPIEVSFDV